MTGVPRPNVCQALMVGDRAVRNWINFFNKKGADGLIVKKRPGRTAILKGDEAKKYAYLIANPKEANREFWTAKAFHEYISEAYEVECSYQTVVRFFMIRAML
ncbi:MAG: helix-turn-helix domain-containing protein [Desulfobacter sp.]|nr:MAG: helix-turn-helix domain-containing protein [Desulfobacter sp.]